MASACNGNINKRNRGNHNEWRKYEMAEMVMAMAAM